MNLFEVAREITHRLESLFLRDERGRRPVNGGVETFQKDPHWRDHILFYEYFHGDNGAGVGAAHQTGWTAVVAPLMQLFARVDATAFLEGGRDAVFRRPAGVAPRAGVGDAPREGSRSTTPARPPR
jgi:hypothetical protein